MNRWEFVSLKEKNKIELVVIHLYFIINVNQSNGKTIPLLTKIYQFDHTITFGKKKFLKSNMNFNLKIHIFLMSFNYV